MQTFTVLGGPLYQWDKGRIATVDTWRGHDVHEVHFQNPNGVEALRRETFEREGVTYVEIPDVLLQSTALIHIYAVNTAEGVDTLCDCVLPIIPKQKPANYVYEDDEVRDFDDLLARIEALEQGGASAGGSSVRICTEGAYNAGLADGSITAAMICFITDGGEEPEQPEQPDQPEQSGVEQSGSVLYVYSGVAATFSGDTLTMEG